MKMFDEFGAKFETFILSKIDTILQKVQNNNVNQTDIGLRRSGQHENKSSDSKGYNTWTFDDFFGMCRKF